MITLLKSFFYRFLFDPAAFVGWVRGFVLGGGGALAIYSGDLEGLLGAGSAKYIKAAGIVFLVLGGLIRAGDKNAPGKQDGLAAANGGLRPVGAVLPELLVALALIGALAACALFKPSLKGDEITCAEDAVRGAALAAFPAVEVALTSPGDSWRADLAVKESEVGAQAVLCAVAKLVQDYAPVVAVPATTPEVVVMQTAAWRGKNYLSRRTGD